MGRFDDRVRQDAMQRLRDMNSRVAQRMINQQSSPAFTAIDNNGTCTGPSGEALNVIKLGTPSPIDAAVKINSTTAAMIEEHRYAHGDDPFGAAYRLFYDASDSNIYASKGQNIPNVVNAAAYPSSISGTKRALFSQTDKSILVYGFAFSSTYVENFKWGLISNFSLSGLTWTGTISTGVTTLDFTPIPQPSAPAVMPQDPLGKYPPPTILSSSEGLSFPYGDSFGLPQVVGFWKDSSNGHYHVAIGSAYGVNKANTQHILNDNTGHTGFDFNNFFVGRFLIDADLTANTSTLQYIQDGSSSISYTWSASGISVDLNGPFYTNSGYLFTGSEPGSTIGFSRSLGGIYASHIHSLLNSGPAPTPAGDIWAVPWNQAMPATSESASAVAFSNTEYFTDGTVFGSPDSIKTMDSEAFIGMFNDTQLEKYKSSGGVVAKGAKFPIDFAGSSYAVLDYAIY